MLSYTIFYQGGMRAVVWTDAFQTVVIVCGVIMTIISATVVAGGPVQVWRIGSENHRTPPPE
jgi:Na+/proline symporter